jgi:hypothetical protein
MLSARARAPVDSPAWAVLDRKCKQLAALVAKGVDIPEADWDAVWAIL